MLTRRGFITTGAITGVGVMAGFSFHFFKAKAEYENAVRKTWRHLEGDMGSPSGLMRELVRYATLAPSSHNTQCWKFFIGDQSVSILPDYERRCPVVDPDDHHLFVSLGCAAENFIQAASALGYRGDVHFSAGPPESLEISLSPTESVKSPLFEAIPHRQTTRTEYDSKPLTAQELQLLEVAGTGEGVSVQLITEKQKIETVLDFVIQGNTAQIREPAFVRELKQWIRFNGSQAAESGDGLFSGSSGNPSLPGWLGNLIFNAVFSEKTENDKYARHVRSSAGIAVFISETDDKAHWIEAGRSFQRFALQATTIGVRNAHLNQPVEVPSLRPQFAQALGITKGRPDLVIRFGRGPEMPHSLRRPIEDVLL